MIKLIAIIASIYLVCLVQSNPMTDCLQKLNSETLCMNSRDCSSGCNWKYSCDEYCTSQSTRNNLIVVDDCINIGQPGVTYKSLCKCKYLEDWKNMRKGPGGLAGLACNTMYLGQLFKGAIKTVVVP